MQYAQRDLRAADMLALSFVGFGIVLTVSGVLRLASGPFHADERPLAAAIVERLP